MSSREYSRSFSPALNEGILPRKSVALPQRRVFDFVCAGTGVVVLAPLLALIALVIKLGDGGPVLYSQDRVGQGLRKFRLLKFRSMHAGGMDGSPLTAPGDARVTRVGRFLRRYKLDELPQLVNVLKGEMQLVGVRPQVQRYVDLFPEEYEELLQTPPGITGAASISFRNEEKLFPPSSIEDLYVKKILPVKLQIALQYSRSRTFFSDFGILIRTVLGFPAPSGVLETARVALGAQTLSSCSNRMVPESSDKHSKVF
jgi:lipopolysaccharide/colanic/teichoic acid biosynthesis glycosyltransferase